MPSKFWSVECKSRGATVESDDFDGCSLRERAGKPVHELTVTRFDEGSDSIRFFHAAHAKIFGAATNEGQTDFALRF